MGMQWGWRKGGVCVGVVLWGLLIGGTMGSYEAGWGWGWLKLV